MKHISISMLVAFLAACGQGTTTPPDAGPPKPDTTCDANPEAVTLAQLQTELFGPKCASCHPSTSGADYGDLTSATTSAAMINKDSLFKRGATSTLKVIDAAAMSPSDRLANSTLWLKVSPMSGNVGFRGPTNEITGQRMPNDGTPVTATELKRLKDWICRGAPTM